MFKKIVILLLVVFISCKEKTQNRRYSHSQSNYWYQLLDFTSTENNGFQKYYAHLQATFKTQSDSLFWDSYNNLRDNFYVLADSSSTVFIERHVGLSSAGDSVCLLVPSAKFYKEIYNSDEIPFFSAKDSIVKVNLRINKFYRDDKSVNQAAEQTEYKMIEDYFKSPQAFERARDVRGFFWLEKDKDTSGTNVVAGDQVRVSYQGQFLNGRILDQSPRQLEFRYGTPDQVITGLNIVIGMLKKGQNAKIILPSRLAFGEYGSTNGSVPPYTPLIYEIKIIQER